MQEELLRFLSKLKWVMFVPDLEILKKLRVINFIPFDCEFTVVEGKKSFYKLTEIYNVENKIFSFQYGLWALNHGLKCTNLSLYWRRLNLNGTEINIANPEVRFQIISSFKKKKLGSDWYINLFQLNLVAGTR